MKIEKESLRQQMLQVRNRMDPEVKKDFDVSIVEQLMKEVSDQKYRTVHTFLPIRSEINLYPLIHFLLDNKIVVICPKALKGGVLEHRILNNLQDLEDGPMGTRHPKEALIHHGSIDLIIVPGLAFDKDNYRLGYGGGYYDRFITAYPNSKTLGVAYPFQKLESIPKEKHDVAVDAVISPS